uniref:Uncharacterized protein n=1 Tax=Acrobeloides nanus TaxID=290746 RepID=A0A914C4U0_9BILA
MGLLLMQLSSCIDFDTYVDNDDGRSDGGGTVLWQRSKIKTSAVRSFEHISNQTINLNSFKLDKDYVDNNNQHPAYQVPLQRLSNKQISYLLKKYSMKGTPSLHLNVSLLIK